MSIENDLVLACLSGSTIINIVGSLLVYTLLLFDVKYPMVYLEETIIIIRASVNTLVIAGSVIGAVSGLWMVKVKGLGWTPCLIIVHIHYIYHVWNKWKYEISALKGSAKLDYLRWATKRELHNHNDVCSICYEGMTSAKVTPCGHFYHVHCLDKWISDQNRCPLCSAQIRDWLRLLQSNASEKKSFAPITDYRTFSIFCD